MKGTHYPGPPLAYGLQCNKFVVVLVVAVLCTGFMAYNNNPVASSNKFRSDDYAATLAVGQGGGGITSRENGGKDDSQGFMFISTFNLQNVPPLPTESPQKK